MRKLKALLGYLLYVFVGSILPHYQCGYKWPISRAIRQLSAHLMFISCGKKVDIGRKIAFSSKVSIGNSSSIGDYAHIHGKLTIGNNVMIAPHCAFIASDHVTDDIDTPMNMQGTKDGQITIKDNVWLGYGVTIVNGKRIDHNENML